ncbi:MAG: GGDEF domain-containing protein [Burkholderiales bacterium]
MGRTSRADDYLSKPFNADELRVRLNSGERVLNLQERLRAQASHDALTGILNRRAILDLLKRELGHVARDEASVGVLLADLDEFKHVNDTHGHPVGDAILVEAARRLSAPLRRVDALGRYGGEEFLIVLPRCDIASALQVAERVRCSVAAAPICTAVGDVEITVSLGVGVATKGQATSLDALLLGADQALYRAKSRGRNRVELPV